MVMTISIRYFRTLPDPLRASKRRAGVSDNGGGEETLLTRGDPMMVRIGQMLKRQRKRTLVCACER